MVRFVKNLSGDDEELVSNPGQRHMLVFNDLTGEGKGIVEWFTRKAHHRNTSSTETSTTGP